MAVSWILEHRGFGGGAFLEVGAALIVFAPLFAVQRRMEEELKKLAQPAAAIREVFGTLAKPGANSWFIYSSVLVEGDLLNHAGKRIPALTKDERRVTTIFDIRGSSKIHSMLYAVGADNLKIRTGDQPDTMACENDPTLSLVLIGSWHANPVTERALRQSSCPYQFSDNAKSIMDSSGASVVDWPDHPQDDRTYDYALLVKVKLTRGRKSRVHLIAAGVGAQGTAGACHFLQERIQDLQDEFGDSPFVSVLLVDKEAEAGYKSVGLLRWSRLDIVQE
jgi:hypothetical protein